MKKRILILLVCVSMLIGIPQAGAAVTVLGDANCDGEVTAADASLILRYIVRLSEISEQGLENADADKNGRVESADASAILRYLVRLAPLDLETPDPSANPTVRPTASPTATPEPSATATPELDQTLLRLIKKGTVSNTSDWSEYAEDITRFIQSLPTSNPYRAILYQGATYMGMPYGTSSGHLDCSGFVRETYRACGYQSNVYPGGSSDSVIQWFLKNQKSRIHNASVSGYIVYTNGWKPGYVLGYVDSEGKGNHVSIYLGCVDGIDFVMESATKAGGVCIRKVWTTDTWQLKYYINPLD